MISVPLKRTDEVDWVTPLKRYIAVSYQDDPEKYAEEAGTIHRLRQDMRGAGNDATGRDVLYRYFSQLDLLDLRFPVDEAHIKIGFMWYVREEKLTFGATAASTQVCRYSPPWCLGGP